MAAELAERIHCPKPDTYYRMRYLFPWFARSPPCQSCSQKSLRENLLRNSFATVLYWPRNCRSCLYWTSFFGLIYSRCRDRKMEGEGAILPIVGTCVDRVKERYKHSNWPALGWGHKFLWVRVGDVLFRVAFDITNPSWIKAVFHFTRIVAKRSVFLCSMGTRLELMILTCNSTQPETPQTCCKLSILYTGLMRCVNKL